MIKLRRNLDGFTLIELLVVVGIIAVLAAVGIAIYSGTLKSYIEQSGLLGVTSNPSIFQQAISQGEGYGQDIKRFAKQGASTLEIYDALTFADIRRTCDLFLPVFKRTNEEHGFVSLEVLPCLAFDEEITVAEAKRLFKAVNKPNVMIKVPATSQGVKAVERLIGDGININVTLIFSQQNYRDVANAYLRGLHTFARKGGDLSTVHSVASVFVSRIDTFIDKQLDGKIAAETDAQKKAWFGGLKGKAAIANSKMIYQDFKKIFGSIFGLGLAGLDKIKNRAAGLAPRLVRSSVS